ncbi:MAG: L,D-transpeptidase [Bacteroidota bacterium]
MKRPVVHARRWVLGLCGLVWLCVSAAGQVSSDLSGLRQMVKKNGTDVVAGEVALLFARADSTQPIGEIEPGEPVHRLIHRRGWVRVRTALGSVGYVRNTALSNVWIYVSKNEQMVYVYRGHTLVEKLPADFGRSIKGDKIRRGSLAEPEHWRTPEGLFYISKKNPYSRFYKALVLNYPTPRHAARGLKSGLISRWQYADIVKAQMVFRNPPMNTPLGGWIEFHGDGVRGRANWTWGCVALENDDVDKLWELAEVGTPVLIGPYAPELQSLLRRRVTVRQPEARPVESLIDKLQVSSATSPASFGGGGR